MENNKKPYEPPVVRKVSLRPEEAVLGSCKISGSGGPVTHCGRPGGCKLGGS